MTPEQLSEVRKALLNAKKYLSMAWDTYLEFEIRSKAGYPPSDDGYLHCTVDETSNALDKVRCYLGVERK